MNFTPELPAAYELVYLDQVDSLRHKAAELAEAGVQEGTLVWAGNQANAIGRLEKPWLCNPGDLHCSIILRPDFEPKTWFQMLVVAVVSLGNAIASFVSPMIALGYGWPNDLLIATSKLGGVWLDQQEGENPSWLAITVSVNISAAPEDSVMDAISLKDADSNVDINAQFLLEAFAREFIKQINNWSDRGYAYILKQWTPRIQGINDPVTIQMNAGILDGVLERINENGDAEIITRTAKHMNVTIAEHTGLDG